MRGQGGKAELTLDWRESGVKLNGVPDRRGFGTDLLERSLAYDLDGTTVLEFRPTGLHCTITLPLDRVALQPE